MQCVIKTVGILFAALTEASFFIAAVRNALKPTFIDFLLFDQCLNHRLRQGVNETKSHTKDAVWWLIMW